MLSMYYHPRKGKSRPENVQTHMIKAQTGADVTTVMTMEFLRIEAVAVLSTSLAYNGLRDGPCIIIGTRG